MGVPSLTDPSLGWWVPDPCSSVHVIWRGAPFSVIFLSSPSSAGETQTQGPVSSVGSHRFSSVQFSRSVVSDSLRPHESQHARPPCPSPTPRVHSDSRPSSQ